jgi:hypothetical protein
MSAHIRQTENVFFTFEECEEEYATRGHRLNSKHSLPGYFKSCVINYYGHFWQSYKIQNISLFLHFWSCRRV